MRCGKAKRLLSAYLDGITPDTLKTDLENHLKSCKVCAQELAALKQTDELVRLKSKEHPSLEYWDSYWPRLKGRLEKVATLAFNSELSQDRNPAVFCAYNLRLALNGVLAALLILTVGMLYRNSRQIKTLRLLLKERQVRVESLLSTSPPLLKTSAAQPMERSVKNQVKLFREIREVFPKTIRWVVTNNGKIELGLASERILKEAARQEELPVFLQFKVLRNGRIPEIVSSPEMMVLSGDEINTRLDGLSAKDKTVYRYRCLPRLRTDGRIDLLVKVSLDNSVLETALIAGEGEIELGKLRKGDAEYSICVTIRSKGLNTIKADKNKKI